jgi:hypothetical protein
MTYLITVADEDSGYVYRTKRIEAKSAELALRKLGIPRDCFIHIDSAYATALYNGGWKTEHFVAERID